MIDVIAIAAAVTTVVRPFMPLLMKGAEKMTDVIAEKGGEAAWEKAQDVWNKIMKHFGHDSAVTGAATVVADEPENEDAQKLLTSLLAKRLEANEDLAKELQTTLGGPDRIQELIAGNEAWVENIRQSMKGPGKQRIQAGDKSVFRGIVQDQS